MSTDDSGKDDRLQLLQNLYGMIGEVNAAAFHAATFSKKATEGVDPKSLKQDGPGAKVFEMGLEALKAATAAAVAINDLSEKAVQLSQEIRSGRQLNE